MILSKRIKQVALCVAVVFLITAAALRIAYVNTLSSEPPVEYYPENTWVNYYGAYAGVSTDNTDGLSIKVKKATVLTPKEFVDSQTKASLDLSKNTLGKYVDVSPATAEVPSILAVEFSFRRSEENTDGQYSAIDWRVISQEHPSVAMQPDWDLWELANPQMVDQDAFTIEQGSEYSAVVPFCAQAPLKYFTIAETRDRLPLDPGEYDFVVTNVPVRKIITFSAQTESHSA